MAALIGSIEHSHGAKVDGGRQQAGHRVSVVVPSGRRNDSIVIRVVLNPKTQETEVEVKAHRNKAERTGKSHAKEKAAVEQAHFSCS